MKKLRVGYAPLSLDFSHPGDRRRIIFWAKNRGHTIVTDLDEPFDVLVLSERSDFGAFAKTKVAAPVILDLVDGYLAKESTIKDLLRGSAKVLSGALTGYPKPFTSFVESLCKKVAAVICSCPEQLELVSQFNVNTHVILDSHDELPMIFFREKSKIELKKVIWEGLPATINGLRSVQGPLSKRESASTLKMDLVTDPEYYLFLNKYVKRPTSSLVNRVLKNANLELRIVPWSPSNLISSSQTSNLAIIPIDLTNPIQSLKPENRLLIMWRLGLPCLTSASPAYSRVSSEIDSPTICYSSQDWQHKIDWLMKDASAAEHIVKNGQAYLRNFHNSELLLEKWDKAIDSVL